MTGDRVIEDAVVRISPSFIGFREALRSNIEREERNAKLTVGINLNASDLSAKVTSAVQTVDREQHKVKVGVELVNASFAALETKLAAISRNRRVTVDVHYQEHGRPDDIAGHADHHGGNGAGGPVRTVHIQATTVHIQAGTVSRGRGVSGGPGEPTTRTARGATQDRRYDRDWQEALRQNLSRPEAMRRFQSGTHYREAGFEQAQFEYERQRQALRARQFTGQASRRDVVQLDANYLDEQRKELQRQHEVAINRAVRTSSVSHPEHAQHGEHVREVERIQAEIRLKAGAIRELNAEVRAENMKYKPKWLVSLEAINDKEGGGSGVGGRWGALLNPEALSAIVPIAQSATGGVLGLASAFITAGSAAGIFAVAAIGHFKQLKDTIDQQAKGPKYNLGDGPTGQAVGAFTNLRKTYNSFLDQTRAPVLGAFTAGITAVSGLLPKLVPVVNAVAGAIHSLIDSFSAFSKSTGFDNFLNLVKTDGVRALESFGRILGNLGGAIGNVVSAFSGLGGNILGGLEGATKRLADWTADLSKNKAFNDFVNNVKERGPIVLATLEDFAKAFVHVAGAAAGVGTMVLQVVGAFSRLVTSIPTHLIVGLLTVWVAYRAVLLSVRGVTLLFAAAQVVANVVSVATFGLVGRLTTGVQSLIVQYLAWRSATGAVTAAQVALASTMARTGIGLIVIAIGTAIASLASWGNASDNAAENTAKFKSNVDELTQALVASNGALDDNVRKTAKAQLERDGLLKVGQKQGISPDEMVDAYLGDPAKWKKITDESKKQRDEYEKTLKPKRPEKSGIWAYLPDWADPIKNSPIYRSDEEQKNLDAKNADVAAMESSTTASEEAQAAAKRLGISVDFVTAALRSGSKAWAEYQAALQKSPQEQMFEDYFGKFRAMQEAQRNQARTAQDTARAEVDAARRIVDAQEAVRQAALRVKQTTKDLMDAREEARRKLRDMADTEESLKIAQIEAHQQLFLTEGMDPGNLIRRKAVLDAKNADEAVADFAVDKSRTPVGVENQPNVVQAKEALRTAKRDESTAQFNLTRAYQDQTRTIEDGKKARDDAIRQVNDTTEAYNRATQYLHSHGIEIDLTTEKGRQFAKKYTATLIANNGDANKDLMTTLQLVQALKLAGDHPDWSYAQAWTAAGQQVTSNANAAKAPAGQTGAGGGTRSIFGPQAGLDYAPTTGATGGPIVGAGTGTSDSVPAWGPRGAYLLSNGEHVWTAAEVQAAGGHQGVMALRNAVLNRYAGGGEVYGPFGNAPTSGSYPSTGDVAIGGPRFTVPSVANKLIAAGLLDRIIAAGTAAPTDSMGAPSSASTSGSGPLGKAPFGQDSGLWKAMEAILSKQFSKISFYSAYRANSITGSGNHSYHGSGQAVDMSPMKEYFDYIVDHYKASTLELIWKGDPDRNIWNGQWHRYSDSLLNQHGTAGMANAHIHWAAGTGLAPGSNFGSTAGLTVDKLKDWFLAGGGGATVGGDLGGWMASAIRYANVPSSWIGGPGKVGLYTLIMRESGGNPRNINTWDSNAQRGDPSRGLMQTIGSTFNHYRDPRLSADIYDPVSNIAAGLNYIKARYGDIFHVQQADPNKPPMGYGSGGAVIADNGAILPPHSRTVIENRTASPEHVGFPMSRDDMLQLAQLIAQALQTRPEVIEMDGEPVARKSRKSVADMLAGVM